LGVLTRGETMIQQELSQEKFSVKHTTGERKVYDELVTAFEESELDLALRLQGFARHTKRQDIARFLVRYEIFKESMPANGSIVECGVYAGAGLMSWMHFSSILEPYNYMRKVIGFDTFSGFPSIHREDLKGKSQYLAPGALQTHDDTYEELLRLAEIHDRNRPLGHMPKIELVKGDACDTIPSYVARNPHLLVSLLYLDFDIYEPTMAALAHLYPRVVRGGIVAFDELNCAEYPGETTAMLDAIGMPALKRSPFDPMISYFVKE
jgi:hypothetical protein